MTLTRFRRTDGQFTTGEWIYADVIVQEKHAASAQVTRFPVETGFSISDAVLLEPRTLSLDGIFSSVNMEPVRNQQQLTQGPQPPPAEKNDIRYQELLGVWQNRGLLEVNTGIVKYDFMCITSLSVTRDKDTGSVISFSMSLQEVVYADAQKAVLFVESPTLKAEEDKGKQKPREATEEERKSVLKHMSDYLGKALDKLL